jgi:UDP-N-acetylmuramoyl-L-alanyl-D-glutamate--2,6-diaminopimelate ligase
VIHDRYEAIKHGINIARPGDLVLIAGKGHETTQTLKDRTIHFNDVEVADEVLRERLEKKK